MRFLLSCPLAQNVETERAALRVQHLAYIREHRAMIVFGGPSLNAAGVPHTMTIVIEAPDLPAAERFSREEPYTAAGVFTNVTVSPWAQVLPELSEGTLDREIAKERAKRL